MPFKHIPEYGSKDADANKRTMQPVLEIVTQVTSQNSRNRRSRRNNHRGNAYFGDSYDSATSDSEVEISSKPARIVDTHMLIHSEYLVNALRATVTYYPYVDLHEDSVKIEAPYYILVHHRDALAKYKFHQPASHSSEYARMTAEHIDVLLNFVEQTLGDSIRKEEERYSRNTPVATFDNYWMALRPGEVIYAKQNDFWQPLVVSNLAQEDSLDRHRRQWIVVCWLMESHFGRIMRRMAQFKVPSWSGEQVIQSLPVMPARFFPDGPKEMLEKQVKLGKLYWELLQRPTYMEYDGQLVHNATARPVSAVREPSGNVSQPSSLPRTNN